MKYLIYTFVFLTTLMRVCQANDLIIKNVTLINPIDSTTIVTAKHQWLLIKNSRIAQISDRAFKHEKAIKVLDGSGKFLIPGLMDSHVHTADMPGLRNDFSQAPALQQAYAVQQPKSYLYYGITQLLDPSRTANDVLAFNQQPVNPDLFFCGAAPIVGGYNLLVANLSQAIARHKYFIYEADRDGKPPAGFDPAQHTPEMVVQRMSNDGAKCIKVYIEDGFDLANDWPMISNDLLKRVRNAASKHGLLMMAHANAVDMQRIALDVKVDILAHGLWNWLLLDSPVGIPKAVIDIADDIVANKTIYQPTLNVMRSLHDLTIDDHLSHPAYKNVLSQDALQWYGTTDGQWFKRIMTQGWGDRNIAQIGQRLNEILNQGERVFQYLYQQGHPMILATDTPPAPTFASQPGLSSYWELKHMHRLGMALPQLLAAATINNAVAFKMEDDYGSITHNKVANLLLLNANPLVSVTAYDKIDTIILHGEVHARHTFKVNNEPK